MGKSLAQNENHRFPDFPLTRKKYTEDGLARRQMGLAGAGVGPCSGGAIADWAKKSDFADQLEARRRLTFRT